MKTKSFKKIIATLLTVFTLVNLSPMIASASELKNNQPLITEPQNVVIPYVVEPPPDGYGSIFGDWQVVRSLGSYSHTSVQDIILLFLLFEKLVN